MRTNQGRRWGQALDLWGLIRWKVKHCICLHYLDKVSWLREEAGLGLSLERPQEITSRSMSWPTKETKRDQTDGTIRRLGDRATRKRKLQGVRGWSADCRLKSPRLTLVINWQRQNLNPCLWFQKPCSFQKAMLQHSHEKNWMVKCLWVQAEWSVPSLTLLLDPKCPQKILKLNGRKVNQNLKLILRTLRLLSAKLSPHPHP